MKPLIFVEPKPSAKQFLLKMVPQLLQACGVAAEQSFFGFKFNIQAEAAKRIGAMSEAQASQALEALKELLQEW